jgi:polyhydroxyalkanoate synthesis regulator phasin
MPEDISQRVEDLETEASNNGLEFRLLKERFDELEGLVKDLKDDLKQVGYDIDNLKASVRSLEEPK